MFILMQVTLNGLPEDNTKEPTVTEPRMSVMKGAGHTTHPSVKRLEITSRDHNLSRQAAVS